MSKKANDYRADIEFSKKMLAEALNRIYAANERLEYVFENRRDWNSDVKFQIEEGATRLGYALACLTTWYDDEEESENE